MRRAERQPARVRRGAGLDGKRCCWGFSRPSRAENLQKAMGCLSPISSGCHCSSSSQRLRAGVASVPAEVDGGDALVRDVRRGRTLSVSLIVVVGYYELLDRYPDANGFPRYGLKSRLDARATRPPATPLAPFPARCCPMTGRAGRGSAASASSTHSAWMASVCRWLFSLEAGHVPGGGRKLEDRAVRSARYLILVLLLETGVLGAFLALDFFLFYVFYELMLVPMFVLIGLWGGSRRLCGHQVRAVHAARIGRAPDLDDRPLHRERPRLRRSERSASVPMNWRTPTPIPSRAEAEARRGAHLRLRHSLQGWPAVMLILNGQEDRLAAQDSPTDALAGR